jgi:hypothetical protein
MNAGRRIDSKVTMKRTIKSEEQVLRKEEGKVTSKYLNAYINSGLMTQCDVIVSNNERIVKHGLMCTV